MSHSHLHLASRWLARVVLAVGLAACGGGNEPTSPPPTPTAAIALGAGTASITAGGTATVPVTVTRGGGFAGAVTVTGSGLPTGVTASTETIAAGATTATVTLTAAANAPAASAAAASITGSGGGVTIAPQALALSVTPPAGASIALSAASGTVQAGSSGTVTVALTRTGGFAGDVVIAATSLPTGVTVASQTIAGGATSASLTIATTTAAAAATTNLSITATGPGVSIAPQAYALTITPAPSPITQIGSDILNSDGGFGARMALSATGNRLVVSAYATANGTTRVYERTGAVWTQLGQDIIGEAAGDQAGQSVAINAAGTRIAVGGYLNDGGGVNSGHVRVFDLVGNTWTQVGADLDGGGGNWGIGGSVALSGSGDRVVAGGPGVGGGTGRVMVWQLTGGTWVPLGNVLTANNEFAASVDISSDGTTIAVSAPSASGLTRAGTVQVYRLSGSTWTQLGNTLQGIQINDNFGLGLSLTATGARVAVASPGDSLGGRSGGGSTGGAVRVFDLIGGTWTQVGNTVLGTTGVNGENLGEALVISDDGTRFAASGASQSVTRVFSFANGAWTQTGANITNNTGAARTEGLALSADGTTVAAGFINGTPRRARVFSIAP